MVQVSFKMNVAHEGREISQAPAPLLPEPGSLQPWQVKQDTRKVLARSTLHGATTAVAAEYAI